MTAPRSSVAGHALPSAVTAMMNHVRHLAGTLRREPQAAPSDWRNEPSAPVGWWKAL
ncbi:hypothetical protein [Mycobacterium sp. SMC-4]|uniref:hypothetical protein n=1 Tax=Mycobacterium sp. SMC-4 TaxID=2857059 RepID=UPI003CFC4361